MCASGSQQVQNKLLGLAWGSFLHVSDPTNFYLGTLSTYGCQPKSVLMLLAIWKKSCKNEPLNCREWRFSVVALLFQNRHPNIHVQTVLFLFQQLLIVTRKLSRKWQHFVFLLPRKKCWTSISCLVGTLTVNAFHEQFHYCPFIFFSYCIVGLNVLFLWSSLTIRLSLASPQQAIAASAHLFPPHRQAGMKHLLLHNQIPTVMISWAKQILSIMQFS